MAGEIWGTTPLNREGLKPGTYEVKITREGYHPTSQVVALDLGEIRELNLEMKSIVASVPDPTPNSGSLVDMVQVQGGTFMMGGNVSTTVSTFWIGRTEVTQAQWKAVMGTNPSNFKGDNLPVEQVNWYDAVEFCNKLSQMEGLTPAYTVSSGFLSTNVTLISGATGYRLPTEAQWEFSARGGNASKGTKYSGSDNAEQVGWIFSNNGYDTQPVGTKSPNELGIYDLTGNVFEWCEDWYGDNLAGGKDPQGPDTGSYRVLRGGSWKFLAEYATVSYRYNDFNPGYRSHSIGFRVVRP